MYDWTLEDTQYAIIVTAGGRTAAQSARDDEMGVGSYTGGVVVEQLHQVLQQHK